MALENKNQSKRVCVIGAGPSGLVAARELRKEGHIVVVMEQKHDIGGQWLYEPNVEGEDPLARANKFPKVHSSIYESLRLLSPREIMGYADFPFLTKEGRDERRFPSHRELFLYIKDFCEFFGLRELIRFNTRVEYVGMVDYEVGKDNFRWVVRSKSVDNMVKKVVEEVYDAVVVATGHYTQSRLPIIKGMESWKRRQMHSHVYRNPNPFRNEVVVVVGNAMSGQDISMELAGVAKEVYLSSKSLDIFEGLAKVVAKHQNLHIRPQIKSLEEDGRVVFVDGTSIVADTIIYSTGYSYSFPFLDTNGIVTVDDNRVGPLYEHTFPPVLAPSLSFVGLLKRIVSFHFFEAQSKWIAELLSGKKALPPKDVMMKSIQEFYQSSEAAGIPKHLTHDVQDLEYCDKYNDNVGFPHLEDWRKEIFIYSFRNFLVNLENFRDEYDDDELLQKAHQSPHYTQFDAQANKD